MVSSSMDVLAKHAERVTKAKDDLIQEEKKAIEEKEQLRRKGVKDVAEVRERARRELEFANRMGEDEKLKVSALNRQNIDLMNQQNQQRMTELAASTAKEIESLRARSAQQLNDFNASQVEKLLENAARADDPFYRAKQFSTEIDEKEAHYEVKIKLPPHEARDVLVSGYSNKLKLTFNRQFEADTKISPTQSNSTRAHESITESYVLPTNINFKNLTRTYADGVLTLNIAKANPVQFNPEEGDKEDISVAAKRRQEQASALPPGSTLKTNTDGRVSTTAASTPAPATPPPSSSS